MPSKRKVTVVTDTCKNRTCEYHTITRTFDMPLVSDDLMVVPTLMCSCGFTITIKSMERSSLTPKV